MKHIVFLTAMIGIVGHSQAMQHAPVEIQEMCKNTNITSETVKREAAPYHCNRLAQYFYCAHAMNTNATPKIKSYCDQVYEYDRTSRKTGLPTEWSLTYHIKGLAEERNKSSEEIVDYIEKSQTVMDSFVQNKAYFWELMRSVWE